ncbi:hypothetical protein D3C79_636150 [compost metagenome]
MPPALSDAAWAACCAAVTLPFVVCKLLLRPRMAEAFASSPLIRAARSSTTEATDAEGATWPRAIQSISNTSPATELSHR